MSDTKPWPAHRVLIGEDVPAIARVIGALIAAKGLEVIYASTGPEVLARALSEPISVVVLDNQMPGLTGVEVARRLLQERPGLPVILASVSRRFDTLPSNIYAVVDKSDLISVADRVLDALGPPVCPVERSR